jgi:hypothetical protein
MVGQGRAGLGQAGLGWAGLGWAGLGPGRAGLVYLNPLFYEVVEFLMMKQLHLKGNICKEVTDRADFLLEVLSTLAFYGKERPTSARSDRG